MRFNEESSGSLFFKDLQLLENVTSSVQQIKIFHHKDFGKLLIINDELQHVENLQNFYHEAITHLPLIFCKSPRKVLILGGGDLFAANELLHYNSISEITICDHDPTVIELMRKHYTHADDTIQSPKLKIYYKDAKEFIDEDTKKYDLIINDCFDLQNTFGNGIFLKLFKMLTDNGICSDLIYRSIFEKETTLKTIKNIKKFANFAFSLITVPEYPGMLHLLSIWGKNANIKQTLNSSVNDFHKELIRNNVTSFKIFNPNFVNYYLYLPRYLKEKIINM